MQTNTIDFITMGCSKNLVDTERLMRQLQACGYRVRHDARRPDESKRANCNTSMSWAVCQSAI